MSRGCNQGGLILRRDVSRLGVVRARAKQISGLGVLQAEEG